MSGLFEHLAAFDDSERVAARKAAAVANKRVKDQVGDFLANATSPEDFESRLSLVDDDIKTAVADVVAEYGGDAERVEAAVRRSIADSSASESSGAEAEPDADEDNVNYSASCKHCKGKGCLKCKEAKSCNCWDGYERVPGTEPCSPGSCRKCDDHRKSSDQSNDYDRADEGASTDFTVDNLCPECGDDLGDDYVEVDGTPYGRPDRTVALHSRCARDVRRNSNSIDEQLAEAPSAVGNTSLENGEVEEKPNFLAAAGLADSNKHEFDENGYCINCGEHTISVRQGCPVGNNEHYDIPRHDVDTNAGWSGEPNNGNYPRMATQFRPRGDDRNPYGEGNTDDYQDSGRDDPAESWGENVDSSGHRIVPMRPEHARHLEMCYPGEQHADKNFAVLDSSGVPVAAFNDQGLAVGQGNKPLPVDETGFSAPLSGEFPESPEAEFDKAPIDRDFPIRPRQPIDLHRGSIDRHAADAPEGSGGAVKREKLPKGDVDATGAPSPKIDKSKAGDEKGHKKRDIDTEMDGSPHPEWRDKQDVTTGRGDAEKGTSDYTHSSPELTSDTLKKEELPTGNEDAQSTERNIEQNKTETFPNKGQADPVTSSVSERIDSLMKRATEMSNRHSITLPSCMNCGAFFSVDDEGCGCYSAKQENGEFFVIKNRKKAAGPFSSFQEAQSRATELNSKENLGYGWQVKGSSIDPDKNPIQEILNDFNQDQSAIAEFERKAMTDPSCNCNGNCNGTCQR